MYTYFPVKTIFLLGTFNSRDLASCCFMEFNVLPTSKRIWRRGPTFISLPCFLFWGVCVFYFKVLSDFEQNTLDDPVSVGVSVGVAVPRKRFFENY